MSSQATQGLTIGTRQPVGSFRSAGSETGRLYVQKILARLLDTAAVDP